MAHQGVGEGRLARSVRSHDRVDLAGAHDEVDPLEDLPLVVGGGRDAEVADDEIGVGGHGGQGSWGVAPVVRRRAVRRSTRLGRGLWVGEGDALRDELGEGHPLERAADRVADADPEQVDRAARGPVAGELVAGMVVLGRTDHRGDGALERAQDVGHGDRGRWPGQFVAAAGAPGRDDESGVAQAHHELLEVRSRELLFGGDLGQAGRPGAVVASELDHQPDAVLALRREGDGAAAVELGSCAQDGVLEFRLILSGLSLPNPASWVNADATAAVP